LKQSRCQGRISHGGYEAKVSMSGRSSFSGQHQYIGSLKTYNRRPVSASIFVPQICDARYICKAVLGRCSNLVACWEAVVERTIYVIRWAISSILLGKRLPLDLPRAGFSRPSHVQQRAWAVLLTQHFEPRMRFELGFKGWTRRVDRKGLAKLQIQEQLWIQIDLQSEPSVAHHFTCKLRRDSFLGPGKPTTLHSLSNYHDVVKDAS
jgi:hypothetical protein